MAGQSCDRLSCPDRPDVRPQVFLLAAIVAANLASACATGPGTASPAQAATAGSSAGPTKSASIETPAISAQPPSDSASPLPPSSPPAGAILDQPWATMTLTNVTTGQPFRIADLVASGKVVFLETMAIWCSNCKAQQVEATAAFKGLDPARVEWVAIDVESSETAEALARYREENGFPFTYVIADANLARALVAEFGDAVLSPPSVNIVVVGPDGTVLHLRGHKSVGDIQRLATERGA